MEDEEVKKVQISEKSVLDFERLSFTNDNDERVDLRYGGNPYLLLRYLISVRNKAPQPYSTICKMAFGTENYSNPSQVVRTALKNLLELFRVTDKKDLEDSSALARCIRKCPGRGLSFILPDSQAEAPRRRHLGYSCGNVEPVCGTRFVQSEALGDLAAGVAHNKLTFISGISGMGKSELARQYAKVGPLRYVVFLELDPERSTNSPRGTEKIESFSELVERSEVELDEANRDDADKRKLTDEKIRLLENAAPDTLIIVDNLNYLARPGEFSSGKTDELLLNLKHRTGQAKVIVTSQLGEEYLHNFGHVVVMDRYYKEQFGLAILTEYSNRPDLDQQAALEIVRLVGCHTMLLAMLGDQLRPDTGTTIHELLAALRKNLLEALDRKHCYVLKDYTRLFQDQTPYEILKLLFGPVIKYRFTEIERQVLGALLLTPTDCHGEATLAELVGDLPDDPRCRGAVRAIYSLEARNIIRRYRERTVGNHYEELLGLHPLMLQFFKDPSNTASGKPVVELSGEFAIHLLNNAFLAAHNFLSGMMCAMIRHYVSQERPWAQETSDRSAGWLAYFEGSEDMEQMLKASARASLWNYRQSGDRDPEDVAQAEARSNEVFCLAPHAPPSLVGLRHPCIEMIGQGEEGACVYLWDHEERRAWTLINCSQQRLPCNRYFNAGSQAPQTGKMTSVEATYVYVSDDYIWTDKALSLPETVDGAPLTKIGLSFSRPWAMHCTEHLDLPPRLEELGAHTFYAWDRLTSLSLPASLQIIRRDAFQLSPIESLTIPKSVKLIEEGAFSMCVQAAVPRGVRMVFVTDNHNTTLEWGKDVFPEDEGGFRFSEQCLEAHPALKEELEFWGAAWGGPFSPNCKLTMY